MILILVVALGRLISLPIPNFAPIGAMALFGTAKMKDKRLGFMVPLAALFISDVCLQLINASGFYSTMFFVYGAFLLIGVIGLLLKNNASPLRLGIAALTSSIVFFFVSNFGVWALGASYPGQSISLLATYELGIPFFRYTLMGDLFYVAVLFGAFELISKRFFKTAAIQHH